MKSKMAQSDEIEFARGLTRCAIDCFESLVCLIESSDNSFSIGILAGHCTEAIIKAHLFRAGWKEVDIKKLGMI